MLRESRFSPENNEALIQRELEKFKAIFKNCPVEPETVTYFDVNREMPITGLFISTVRGVDDPYKVTSNIVFFKNPQSRDIVASCVVDETKRTRVGITSGIVYSPEKKSFCIVLQSDISNCIGTLDSRILPSYLRTLIKEQYDFLTADGRVKDGTILTPQSPYTA